MSKKSLVLVGLQFIVAGMLLVSSVVSANPLPLIIGAIGLAIGLWAIWSMKISSLRIFPEPNDRAKLIETGPYQWIRHPMYLSVLLISLALFLTAVSWWRFVLLIILADVLLVKLRYEETLLKKKFNHFADYQKKTKRLIPFVY